MTVSGVKVSMVLWAVNIDKAQIIITPILPSKIMITYNTDMSGFFFVLYNWRKRRKMVF